MRTVRFVGAYFLFLLAGVYASATTDDRSEDDLIAILQAGHDRAAVHQAIRELQIVGTEKCIPTLAQLLEDAASSHAARGLLASMQYPAAAAALREALGRSAGGIRVGIIRSIGLRRDEAAIPQLARLLESDDRAASTAAIAALGEIGTTRALDPLRAIGRHPEPAIKAAAADALLAGAEAQVASGALAEAAAIYQDLQSDPWPSATQARAFAGWLVLPDDRAVARITQALDDANPERRRLAISACADIASPELTDVLTRRLPTLDGDGQLQAIGVLVTRADRRAQPPLIAAATAPDTRVRLAALEALGVLGDDACVDVLSDALAGGSSEAEKTAAITSLERLGGRSVHAALFARMRSANPETCAVFIRILAARKAPGLKEELLTVMADAPPAVQRAALEVLRTSAGVGAIPRLVRLLEQGGGLGPSGLENTIVQIARRIEDVETRADLVVRAWERAELPPLRAALLRILGGIGNPAALSIVDGTARGKDGALARQAITVLGNWPDDAALVPLLDLLPTLPVGSDRTGALRGCVRLLGIGAPTDALVARYRTLLPLADTPGDRLIVLSGVARLDRPGAFELVASYLSDDTVRKEAELAWLTIARTLKRKHPAESRAATLRLLESSRFDEIRAAASELLNTDEVQDQAGLADPDAP